MSDRTTSEAARTQVQSVDNPFRMGNSVAPTGGALAGVEQQRGIAEVQARMIIARANPRDPIRAMDNIIRDCMRERLAEGALYQYSRGGSSISGPSIRLAEVLSQRWGNIACGVKEIAREGGYSECVAYAWDLETGFFDEKQFQVRHWRDTKQGGHKITDEREIYELVANLGARRKRACLLTVIPGDVVEAAVEQCEQTLKVSADTSPEALKKIAEAFAMFGVTQQQIEVRCQCHLQAIRPAQVVQLRKIYASLKDGMSSAADWFTPTNDAAAVVAAADAKVDKPAANPEPKQRKPPAAQTSGSAQPVQEVQERQQEPPKAATLYFPTDDMGEPALEDGAAFESEAAFANWMIDTLGVTERPDALIENNRDALDDLRNVSAALALDVEAAHEAATDRLRTPMPSTVGGDTAQEPEPASEPQEASTETDATPLVDVPLTPGKKPHWPNYADECGKAIRALTTQGDVTTWQNRNFPTYTGKAIEAKIEAHLKEHRQRLDDAAARPERDNAQAEDFIADIKACASLNDLAVYAGGVAFKTVRARWKSDRPDLWQRIKAAGDAREAELSGV